MNDTYTSAPQAQHFSGTDVTEKQKKLLLKLADDFNNRCTPEQWQNFHDVKLVEALKNRKSCNLVIRSLRAVLPASKKQKEAVISISYGLRNFCTHDEWQPIRETIFYRAKRLSIEKAHDTITWLKSQIDKKVQSGAPRVVIPESYSTANPAWQSNILRLAEQFFPNENIDLPQGDSISNEEQKDWRVWKNKIELFEKRRSESLVIDDFENDNRPALAEEERWRIDNPSRQETVEGIDYLEAVAGIDYESHPTKGQLEFIDTLVTQLQRCYYHSEWTKIKERLDFLREDLDYEAGADLIDLLVRAKKQRFSCDQLTSELEYA